MVPLFGIAEKILKDWRQNHPKIPNIQFLGVMGHGFKYGFALAPGGRNVMVATKSFQNTKYIDNDQDMATTVFSFR